MHLIPRTWGQHARSKQASFFRGPWKLGAVHFHSIWKRCHPLRKKCATRTLNIFRQHEASESDTSGSPYVYVIIRSLGVLKAVLILFASIWLVLFLKRYGSLENHILVVHLGVTGALKDEIRHLTWGALSLRFFVISWHVNTRCRDTTHTGLPLKPASRKTTTSFGSVEYSGE